MTPEQQGHEAEPTDDALAGTLTRALVALDDLHTLPVTEHVARFEAVHQAAIRALSTIDGA